MGHRSRWSRWNSLRRELNQMGPGAMTEDPNPTRCFVLHHGHILTLVPVNERRMCCASREEHMFKKQYIDASNDESTGKYKESGTIEDYLPVSLEEHWNSKYMRDISPKLLAGEEIPNVLYVTTAY